MSTPTQFGAAIGLFLLSIASLGLAVILSVVFLCTQHWAAAIGCVALLVFGFWTFIQARKS